MEGIMIKANELIPGFKYIMTWSNSNQQPATFIEVQADTVQPDGDAVITVQHHGRLYSATAYQVLRRQYTADDARREIRECVQEGNSFDYIRIFLNDLVRGKDITRQERTEIMAEIMRGDFDGIECSYGTYH